MISNGIDLMKIKRIEPIIKNPIVFEKLFTENERKSFEEKGMILESIAGAFASKEAFGKAMQWNLSDFSFQEVEICHHENYSPYLKFSGSLLDKTKGKTFSLSISHDGEYAIAIVTCSH